MLLTGASNAWLRSCACNRSRAGHGISAWQYSYVRVVRARDQQGTLRCRNVVVACRTPARGSTSATIPRRPRRRDAARDLTYGVVAVRALRRAAHARYDRQHGLNGINVCGAATTRGHQRDLHDEQLDRRETLQLAGWLAAAWRSYLDVLGNAVLDRQHVHRQRSQRAVRRIRYCEPHELRVQANTIGSRFTRTRRASGRAAKLREHCRHAVRATRSMATSRRHLPERHPGTVTATVRNGRWHERGQKNFFKNYVPPSVDAIGCLNVTTNFVVVAGGNS